MGNASRRSVTVIGGGPAGLFCASRASGPGSGALVLEKGLSCGRKLLMSGAGRCNITHVGDISDFFGRYGGNGRFLKPALLNFTNEDLVSFLREHKLNVAVEPGGKVFPGPRGAAAVLKALLDECSRRGVEVKLGEPVTGVSRQERGFLVTTEKATYRSAAVVIASGGMTYPVTGSTGDGFAFARSLGHRVTALSPALAPVTVRDHRFAALAGISFAGAGVTVEKDGRKAASGTGDLLLTHTGLSGPVVMDLSRYLAAGDTLLVSFLRGKDRMEAMELIGRAAAGGGSRRVRSVVRSLDLPERFVDKVLEIAGVGPEETVSHFPREKREKVAGLLAECPFVVARAGRLDEAMVTRGGVELSEINPKTMESRLCPGLFFAGEVLDIDGDTGGYNLQAAFSTAALAAREITRREGEVRCSRER